MHQDTIDIAQAYYTAMAEKKIDDLDKFLDPHVLFVAPLAIVKGKAAFVETVKKFLKFFTSLNIRTIFGLQDQAMVVYTLDFPGSVGKVETAALLHIQNGLIIRIELFYDARPFEILKVES